MYRNTNPTLTARPRISNPDQVSTPSGSVQASSQAAQQNPVPSWRCRSSTGSANVAAKKA